jgi:serine/threonine protein kinase
MVHIPDDLVWAPKPNVDASGAANAFDKLSDEIRTFVSEVEIRRRAGTGSLWGEIEDGLNRLNAAAYNLARNTFRDAEVAKWIVHQADHLRDVEHYLLYLRNIGEGAAVAALKLRRPRAAASGASTEPQVSPISPSDRFAIIAQLGSGGMARVYKAFDKKLGREVALKFPKHEALAQLTGRERFRREVDAAARLEHANIARLYDAQLDGDDPFLVQEFVPGQDLHDVLAAGRLPVPAFITLARQLTSALAHAHDSGIIHRDIKPRNVRITPDGEVKLLDFGLAKWSAIAADDSTQNDLTRRSVVMGTPGYIAPEILLGESATLASDIYSLGVTLCEMLNGTKPTPKAVMRGEPALAGSTELHDLVNACCHADPSERPSAAEVIQRLDVIGRGGPATATVRRTSPSSRSIDEAFESADREARREAKIRRQRQLDAEVYDREVQHLVETYLDAVRRKAEQVNEHPRNRNKATIMPAGTHIRIRRAGTTHTPDRRVEVEFRRDLATLSWIYEVSPNPVYADYETVDSGALGFYVADNELRVQSVGSAEDFADVVLGQYVLDCASDSSLAE